MTSGVTMRTEDAGDRLFITFEMVDHRYVRITLHGAPPSISVTIPSYEARRLGAMLRDNDLIEPEVDMSGFYGETPK
jgi:hypothetical protein